MCTSSATDYKSNKSLKLCKLRPRSIAVTSHTRPSLFSACNTENWDKATCAPWPRTAHYQIKVFFYSTYIWSLSPHFYTRIVCLISSLWIPDSKPHHHFQIPKPCSLFCDKFNLIQQQLQNISGMDELLSGKQATIHSLDGETIQGAITGYKVCGKIVIMYMCTHVLALHFILYMSS